MKLIETCSRWGNLYRTRYYVDGRLVKVANFNRTYRDLNLTNDQGILEKTSFGYRKIWKSA